MADKGIFIVRVTLKGKFFRLRRILRGQRKVVIDQIFHVWSRIYAAFLRARFIRASRGDGTWKALAKATIARRRKRSDAILRDTGLMFAQFSPSFEQPFNIRSMSGNFVVLVSFGGTDSYPDGKTTSEVMSFHQKGGGHLPKRELIVNADGPTFNKMVKAAKKIIVDDLNAA